MSTESSSLSRISRIETLWSVVRQAHHGPEEVRREAQRALLERYGGAVRRYLRAALRDGDAADEMFQEFALRFVRGDFRSADPERGRFRDFVKTTLYHLIVDYYRGMNGRPSPLLLDADAGPALAEDAAVLDEEIFQSSWRQELLNRCWEAQAEAERAQGTPFYSALRIVVDNPHRRSHEIAAQLSQQWGKPITAGNLRVVIHRARKLFADALIDEVRESLDGATVEAIEQELIDLKLLEYCRSALTRLRESQLLSESQDGHEVR